MTSNFTVLALSILIVFLPMSLSIFTLKNKLTLSNHSLTFTNLKICDYNSMPLWTSNRSLYLWDKQIISGTLPRTNYFSCSSQVSPNENVQNFLISILQVGTKTRQMGNILHGMKNNKLFSIQWNPFKQIDDYEIYRVQFSQQNLAIKILNQKIIKAQIHIFQKQNFKFVTKLTFSILDQYFKMDQFGSLFILSSQQKLKIIYGKLYDKIQIIDISDTLLRIERIQFHNFNHTVNNMTKIIVYYAMGNLKMARPIKILYKNDEIQVTVQETIFKESYFKLTHCGDRTFEYNNQQKCLSENNKCVINQFDDSNIICIQQNYVGNGKVKILTFQALFQKYQIGTALKYYQEYQQDDQSHNGLSFIVIFGIIIAIVFVIILILCVIIKIRQKREQKMISKQQEILDDNYSQLSQ